MVMSVFSMKTSNFRERGFRMSLLAISLAMSGCQLPLVGQQQTTTGAATTAAGRAAADRVRNDAAAGARGSRSSEDQQTANIFTQFDGVPIPANAALNLEESLILGNEGGWIGRLSLEVDYEMADMYGFYTEEMEKFGWEQLTTVRSKITTMTYRLKNRVSTITLVPVGRAKTAVDFTVAPSNAAVTGTQPQ
jgi:hypothetical protein